LEKARSSLFSKLKYVMNLTHVKLNKSDIERVQLEKKIKDEHEELRRKGQEALSALNLKNEELKHNIEELQQ